MSPEDIQGFFKIIFMPGIMYLIAARKKFMV